MILLLTTSAGAHMVVATVPARAEDVRCNGRPSEEMMPWDKRESLKKSYETNCDAFISTARICRRIGDRSNRQGDGI
jgi:hypothetical protein